VVILTTSADDAEIHRMYELKCSSYIVKPVDFEGFIAAIRSFADYWLTVVVLPSEAAPGGK
jgi:DNA-binding NarL/FixJ family response regulator